MWNSGVKESQAVIKKAERSISFRYADDTTLLAESEEELKSLLMKVKESEKVGFKLNIQKMKIMASCPITSWEIDGETVATGLEKVSFHSNPKERQCQRMLKLPHNCTHLTR